MDNSDKKSQARPRSRQQPQDRPPGLSATRCRSNRRIYHDSLAEGVAGYPPDLGRYPTRLDLGAGVRCRRPLEKQVAGAPAQPERGGLEAQEVGLPPRQGGLRERARFASEVEVRRAPLKILGKTD